MRENVRENDSLNFIEYTMYALLMKDAEKIIASIRKGNKNEGIQGTDSILSFYAKLSDEKGEDAVSPSEVKSLPSNQMVSLKGGFTLLNSGDAFHLFKQSSKKTLEKESKAKLSKLLDTFSFSRESDIDNPDYIKLKEGGLIERKPLNKEDFINLVYTHFQQKNDEVKSEIEIFFGLTNNKPTKTFLKTLSLDELINIVEDRMNLKILSPFFEHGYSINPKERFKIKKTSSLEMLSLLHEDKLESEKDSILGLLDSLDDIRTELKDIERRESEKKSELKNLSTIEEKSEVQITRMNDLNNSLFGLFKEKSFLKDSASDLKNNTEKRILGHKVEEYKEENEEYEFFSTYISNNISCDVDNIPEEFIKKGLCSVHEINAKIDDDIEFFESLEVEFEEKTTLSDYGTKTNLENSLLYGESLLEITMKSLKEKEKVLEIEKTHKESPDEGFAL